MLILIVTLSACAAVRAQSSSQPTATSHPVATSQPILLLGLYPTTLTEGNTNPADACEWEFSPDDVYALSKFAFEGDDGLRVKTGPADLGIGHCAHGAVWAVVLPRQRSQMVSSAAKRAEEPEHIWLRFHPAYIGTILPPDTVRGPGDKTRFSRMQRIAGHKMKSSFHAGRRAMIPPPSIIVLDIDTRGGMRRFFMIDRDADAAQYVQAFEDQTVPAVTPISGEEATRIFDTVWSAFDEHYPMFGLRPEVEWNALRALHRARAARCANTYEAAQVLADLLRPLRDRHITVSAGGEPLQVFSQVRPLNANPQAAPKIVGALHKAPGDVLWGTSDRVGYISIPHWRSPMISGAVDEILDQMDDVRGAEGRAQQVAGRFARKPVVYAHSRVRTGPKHDDLSELRPRSIEPRGPSTFDKPVIVLIGNRSMSSNESFIAMMGELPQVTLMGVSTAGSSGNPKVIEAGADVQVRVPQWIDYRPDGKPLDEIGIDPDVVFAAKAGAFAGNRDDLLAAALERLQPTAAPTSKPKDTNGGVQATP
jgi:hypothetical protein